MVSAITREVTSQSDRLEKGPSTTAVPSSRIGGRVDHRRRRARQPKWPTRCRWKGNGKQSILSVEATASLSANFGTLGDTFRINSSNRQEDGTTAKPGRGNINPIESPVGVPDVSGNKWPSARALSDVSTIGLYASGTDFLLQERVVSIEDKNKEGEPAKSWPGRYRVKMQSIDPQTKKTKTREVYSDQVIVSTGLGTPSIPFTDEGTRKLVQDESRKGRSAAARWTCRKSPPSTTRCSTWRCLTFRWNRIARR